MSNIENEIQAKGLTAPRITLTSIEANIASEHYFTALDGVIGNRGSSVWKTDEIPNTQALSLLTFCVLVLRNGFTVTGDSACVSPENFDAEIGRKIARENAITKVGPLMGYQLRSILAEETALIVVNGRKVRWSFVGDGLSATYERMCAVAGINPEQHSPAVAWTLRGGDVGGILVRGDTIDVVDGLIVTVLSAVVPTIGDGGQDDPKPPKKPE